MIIPGIDATFYAPGHVAAAPNITPACELTTSLSTEETRRTVYLPGITYAIQWFCYGLYKRYQLRLVIISAEAPREESKVKITKEII